MKSTLKGMIGAAACFTAGAVAYAAVNIDDGGLGFAGKGDVQLALEWNNAQLQSNAETLKFRFLEAETYEWECEWYNGPDHNRKRHTVDRITTTGVSSTVAYDARKNKNGQITGFNLNGFEGESVSTGEPGECEGNDKTLVGDSLVLVGDGIAGLQVSADGATWIGLEITQ